MAEFFIEAEVLTEEHDMADNAVVRLQDQWEDWEPSEGDLEVVLIEAISQMASDAADVAAVMPPAAFEQIMLLFGVTLTEGTPATGTVTFALLDELPNTIPAGTEIDIDGYVFLTDVDVETAGPSAPGVAVSADDIGVQANGLYGDQVSMITALSFVSSVALDAPTGGGTDEETEEAYRDKGSRALELQALTLVTGRDYELITIAQPGVAGVVAESNLATRQIKVTAWATGGTVLSAEQKASLATLYDHYRQTTWQLIQQDPTVVQIDITFTVHIYPGFVAEGVLLEAYDLIRTYIDPAHWNAPQYERQPVTTWNVEPLVRKNKIIDLIGNAHGVDYVADVTITGSSGAAQPNGDWLMSGAVPLPHARTLTGTAV